jgi:heavy metal sensor kinase
VGGIGLRVAAWYFSVVAISLLVFGLGSWVIVKRVMYHEIDQILDERVMAIQDSLRRMPPPRSLDALRGAVAAAPVIALKLEPIQIVDDRGNWLYRSPLLERERVEIPSTEELRLGRIKIDETVAGARMRVRSKRVEAHGRHFAVQVMQPVRHLDEGLRRYRLALWSFGPLTLLVSAAGGWWLSRRALRPVDSIIAVAQGIGDRNLSQRLPIPATHDEIQRLSLTLNAMLERIEDAFRRTMRFTADASHELRTPLGLILTNADLALRQERSAADYRQSLAEIREEALRTTQMVESLLEISRADCDQLALHREETNLSALAAECVRSLEPIAVEKRLRLGSNHESCDIVAHVDPMAIRRLLLILLDNAIKFTPSGGHVDISLNCSEGAASITVRDSGIGVEAQDIPRLFDRFYRGEKSRSRKYGGTGLGLAMAKWIVDLHGGAITVESQVNCGSRFAVRLPLGMAS